ncbi:MAG: LuxR C-terminal-related transcriptional regulator [Phycisphaerales bacterium]
MLWYTEPWSRALFEHLTSRDVHACHELAGSCRELGADVDAWRERMIHGLRGLVRAQVVIMAELVNLGEQAEEPMRSLATHRVGWADDAAERRWAEYAASNPVERKPEFPYINRFKGDRLTLSRDEIWGRETWYRSKTFNEVHKACGIDDYVMSVRATTLPGRSLSIWLHRSVGDDDFGDRERALVALVHDAVCGELGGFLSWGDEPRLCTLTPRRREVLASLLRGDSEKQIAYELGIGRATIHEHVLGLYKHFGVSSRGELLSLFIGRARPDLTPTEN